MMTTTFTGGAPPGNEEAPAATEALQNTDDDNDQQHQYNGHRDEGAAGNVLGVSDYLGLLGIEDHEHVGMFWKRGDDRKTAVVLRDTVPVIAEHQIPREYDAYLSPNPTAGPVRINDGRGTEEQVTRITAAFADLDVKPGACQSIDAAHEIVHAISERIEERPTLVIFSGGGLQPIWALEDCSPEVGRPLLRRFGRLVKAIGQERNVKLDSVFDSARVLRIPGSLNHKYGDPIEVSAIPDTGGPIVPETLAERLDEWGITKEDSDNKSLGDVVAGESNWKFALESCGYSHITIEAWMTEPVSERHPWMLCQLTRLECMRRNECLTEADYREAIRKLENRFANLCATQEPRRQPKRYEVRDMHNVAVDRASRKTATELDSEYGAHPHLFQSAPAPSITGAGSDAPQGETEAPVGDSAPGAAAADGLGPLVDLEYRKQKARQEAKRLLDEENRPPLTLPPVKSLNTMLAEPDSPTKYLIEDLAPAGARTLLSAPQKAGKTSLTGNLSRCLADGDKFLGEFTIHERKKHIVLIDTELSEDTLRRWLREQNIRTTDAVADVVSLRGKVSTFNLIDDKCRAIWAQRLRDLGCDYLMLDCLRPVLDSLGLDENRDAGRFLVAFDALLDEAGIPDALMVQHMGHANERARGDSRLQDWPDALWRLVREDPDDPASPRYFSAHGRDVDVAEGRIDYDPATRRITYAGGNRKQAKAAANEREALAAVVDLLAVHYMQPITDDDGNVRTMTTNTVEWEMQQRYGISNRRVGAALKQGLDGETPALKVEDGPNRSKIYSIANPCQVCGKPVTGPNSVAHRECEQ